MNPIKWVVLIIEKDGKFLVEKRKSSKEKNPSKIVVPGGHINENESLEKACKRELKEEFGLDCEKFEFVINLPFETNNKMHSLFYFYCQDWKGELQCLEAEEIFWIGIKEFSLLDYEVDKKALKNFLSL